MSETLVITILVFMFVALCNEVRERFKIVKAAIQEDPFIIGSFLLKAVATFLMLPPIRRALAAYAILVACRYAVIRIFLDYEPEIVAYVSKHFPFAVL